MTIERVNLNIPGSKNPLSFGVRISGKKNHVSVHIFALEENLGPSMHQYLWTIKDHISKTLNTNRKKFWFLTNKGQTTSLNFEYFEGKPLRLDLSNIQVLKSVFEQAPPDKIERL